MGGAAKGVMRVVNCVKTCTWTTFSAGALIHELAALASNNILPSKSLHLNLCSHTFMKLKMYILTNIWFVYTIHSNIPHVQFLLFLPLIRSSKQNPETLPPATQTSNSTNLVFDCIRTYF
jgi:hypothetical protein